MVINTIEHYRENQSAMNMEQPQSHNYWRRCLAAAIAPLVLTACTFDRPGPSPEAEQTVEMIFDEQSTRVATSIAAYLDTYNTTIAYQDSDNTWRLVNGGDRPYAYAAYDSKENELTISVARGSDTGRALKEETFSSITVVVTPGAEISRALAQAQQSRVAPDPAVFTNPFRTTGDNRAIAKSLRGLIDSDYPSAPAENNGTGFVVQRDDRNSHAIYGAVTPTSSGAPTIQEPLAVYNETLAHQVDEAINTALKRTLG